MYRRRRAAIHRTQQQSAQARSTAEPLQARKMAADMPVTDVPGALRGPQGEEICEVDCGSGDGSNSCLFSSFSYLLFNSSDLYMLLRVVATLSMLHDAGDVIDSLDTNACELAKSTYWGEIDRAHVAGNECGEPTLLGLAHALDIEVHYHTKGSVTLENTIKWMCATPAFGGAIGTVIMLHDSYRHHWTAAQLADRVGKPIFPETVDEAAQRLLRITLKLHGAVNCRTDVVKDKLSEVMDHWATSVKRADGGAGFTWFSMLRAHGIPVPMELVTRRQLSRCIANDGNTRSSTHSQSSGGQATPGSVVGKSRSLFEFWGIGKSPTPSTSRTDRSNDNNSRGAASTHKRRRVETEDERSAQDTEDESSNAEDSADERSSAEESEDELRTDESEPGSSSDDPKDKPHRQESQKARRQTLSFKTLKRLDDYWGGGWIATDNEAKKLLKKKGKYRCCKCAQTGVAKAHNIGIHLRGVHKAQPGIASKAHQHILQTFFEKLSDRDAQNYTAHLLGGFLVADGLSSGQVDSMRKYMPLFLVAKTLPSRRALLREKGQIDKNIGKLKEGIRNAVKNRRIVLVIDAATSRFTGGASVITVSCITATEDEPMLLCCELEKKASMDAPYYSRLLQSVLDDYGINKKNVVGVSADNTSTMPRFIKDSGFIHIPCVAHVINLMFEAIAGRFQVDQVFRWKAYTSHATDRVDLMLEAGLSPTKLSWPDTRFGYAVVALTELTERWDEYAKFAVEHPPSDPTAAYDFLRQCMQSPACRLAAALVADICEQGLDLLEQSQCNFDCIPGDFMSDLQSWLDAVLDDARKRPAAYISRVAGTYNIPLEGRLLPETGIDWQYLKDRLVVGVGDAITKATRHFKGKTSGGADSGDFLEILRRRFHWDIRQPEMMPETATDAALALGQNVSSRIASLCVQLRQELVRTKGDQTRGPLPPRTNPINFWRALLNHRRYSEVAKEVLGVLSIPLSNATAERTFSVLRSRAVFNRLHAKSRYVTNMMMLSCNKYMFTKVFLPELQVICRQFGDVPINVDDWKPKKSNTSKKKAKAKKKQEKKKKSDPTSKSSSSEDSGDSETTESSECESTE